MAKGILIPVALAGVLITASAGAQDVLDRGDTQFIQDWVNKNNIDYISIQPAATWQFVGATPGGVTLRAVLAKRKGMGGGARVGLRIEHFAAIEVNTIQAMSELAAFEVDCAKDRIRLQTITGYAQHNLQGNKKEKAARADWIAASAMPLLDGAVRSACSRD